MCDSRTKVLVLTESAVPDHLDGLAEELGQPRCFDGLPGGTLPAEAAAEIRSYHSRAVYLLGGRARRPQLPPSLFRDNNAPCAPFCEAASP